VFGEGKEMKREKRGKGEEDKTYSEERSQGRAFLFAVKRRALKREPPDV